MPKSSLEDKALFPHVMSKNIRFEVNFGERSEPWIAEESYKEDFVWASKVPVEQRIAGPKKPESKSECEVYSLTNVRGPFCAGLFVFWNPKVVVKLWMVFLKVSKNYLICDEFIYTGGGGRRKSEFFFHICLQINQSLV